MNGNKLSHKFRIYYVLWMFVFLSFDCHVDSMPDQVEDPPDTQKYSQYGTPFQDIPGIGDITLYEVNLRALSPTGDLRGVIGKLDHIKSLGVNVIWLMPIHPIGLVNSVNSPYSVRDHLAVSEEYGTMNDLRDLTDEAHARGMAVIMDWVANHTAWDHQWIVNKSWYSQDENGSIIHPPGTNWLDVADLDYSNEEMRTAMIDAMTYWLYEANVDGFRCDYADGVPFDFWHKAWETIDTIQDRDFILFAEGSRADHFDAGFDLNFSWKFYGALKEVFKGHTVNKLFSAQTNEYYNIAPDKHWVRFTTNHDESAWDATPVSLFGGIEGALAASVVSVFIGGVPLIYGSQEVGTSTNVPFFSNSTINWNAHPEMLASYQMFLSFYSSSEVARSGQNTIFPHNDVACFRKSIDNQEIVIMVNLRNKTIPFTVPAPLENSNWTEMMTGNGVALTGQIILSPYQYHILVK